MQTHLLKSETLDYTVPLDILLDVLKILIQNNISYSIKAILENDNSVVIKACFNPLSMFHPQANENIETLITDYRYFLHGSSAD